MCSLGSFLPFYVRLAAHSGFDCIWLDLEHRAMSKHEVQGLMANCHLYDIDCMVRAPTLEKTGLYRYLEDGAAGMMIPHVSTAEKARMLVQSLKFPPLGDRGLDGAGLDSDFSVQGGADYTDQANRETFLVVQIETIEAVENVDSIAATPGVDALFVGPGDLGLRLRHAPDVTWTLEDAIDRVAAAAARHQKAWGMPAVSRARLEELTAKGGQLLAYGGEFSAIAAALTQRAAEIDDVFGESQGTDPEPRLGVVDG
jgi:2-keto-3-deoxy-L-rhamnonate aldolase RhmA